MWRDSEMWHMLQNKPCVAPIIKCFTAEMLFTCYAVVCKEKWPKDYINKNKQTFDVAHRYNDCSSVPHYATTIVAVRHITLQSL
jgi:hypothetical protein